MVHGKLQQMLRNLNSLYGFMGVGNYAKIFEDVDLLEN